MPIFEDVLRSLLIATNLCGNRVYVMRAPQQPTEPYIVIAPTGPEPAHTHDGSVDLILRNYQFSVFDHSQSAALGIGDSLESILDGYAGEYQGVHFAYIFFAAQSAMYESDTQVFHIVTEWRIRFRYLGNFTAVNQRKESANAHGSNPHSRPGSRFVRDAHSGPIERGGSNAGNV